MNNLEKVNEGIIDLNERKAQMTEKNIQVLEQVKNILMLSNTDFMTVQMTAEYFEVGEKAINSLILRNKDELIENGLKIISGKETKEILGNFNKKFANYRGYFECDGIKFNNRTNTLINKRVLLNIGMLLRDSKVAKELRRRILDIVHDAEQTNIVDNIVEEIRTEQQVSQDMLQAILNGDKDKESLLKTELIGLKNKRIIELEGVITNAITITESKAIINKCIRAMAIKKNGNNFGSTWNEFYKVINYKLGINVKTRNGKGLSRFTDDELKEMEIIAKSWCKECGVDVDLKLQ